MPVVINVSAGGPVPHPPLPTKATSPDGYLMVAFDKTTYGAWLKVNIQGMGFITDAVTFTFKRADGTIVRGGDHVISVSREARVYDDELPIGQVVTWYVDIEMPGFQIQTQKVSLSLPLLNGSVSDPSTWLKSIENPNHSTQLMINRWPDMTYEVNMTSLETLNGRFPAMIDTYDSLGGFNGTVQFTILGDEQMRRVLEVLKDGVFWLTASPQFKRRNMYAGFTGKVKVSDVGKMSIKDKILTIDLVETERPSTANQPNRAPGKSYEDRLRVYPKFRDKLAFDYGHWTGLLF